MEVTILAFKFPARFRFQGGNDPRLRHVMLSNEGRLRESMVLFEIEKNISITFLNTVLFK